jgi:hypothetical protein
MPKSIPKRRDWTEAVVDAIKRYSNRHKTRIITRQGLIKEELEKIKIETDTTGDTPEYTLSRELQELRQAGILYPTTKRGVDILLETPIRIEEEDISDEVLEIAIYKDKLLIGNTPTSDTQALTRQRKGQEVIRKLTLYNYGSQCAICDIQDEDLLVTSHIVRWADMVEYRGTLSNVICLCWFHDVLFEKGYISFTDNLKILKRTISGCRIIELNQNAVNQFRIPKSHSPSPKFLKEHRQRSGFEL